jgi:hypothetical protein
VTRGRCPNSGDMLDVCNTGLMVEHPPGTTSLVVLIVRIVRIVGIVRVSRLENGLSLILSSWV